MEEVLRALLKAGLGTQVRVDWGQAPQGAGSPRVVLYRISGGGDYTMAGPSGYRQARVQVDCLAPSVGAAKLLARQVIALMGGYRGGNILGAFLDAERDLQPETDLADVLGRVVLDFLVHYRE